MKRSEDLSTHIMYERLVLCEYVVADLTTANANVFYELGLRHAARPCSTILLFSEDGKQLPIDVGLLQAIPYQLQPDGTPANVDATKAALVKSLMEVRKATTEGRILDSPVFQLVQGYPSHIEHAKTDVSREQVQYSAAKKALALARQQRGLRCPRGSTIPTPARPARWASSSGAKEEPQETSRPSPR
jgi:hypothetical protein